MSHSTPGLPIHQQLLEFTQTHVHRVSDVAQVILNAAPDRMVYVSCNPASQARDLEILCKDYEITAVRPVDMFPHTHHVENVVALKRR